VPSSSSDHVDVAYRSVRIGRLTTLRLRWYARFDRRAGLPVGLSPETTPVLRELTAEYGEVCERERGAFLQTSKAWNVRLRELEAEVAAVSASVEALNRTTTECAAPPTEQWLSIRYPGESHLPESATRARRADAHRAHWQAARNAEAEARRRLEELLAEEAELRGLVEAREEAARSRVRRYRDLTERKSAVYRRALIRRHPQRDQLIGRWTTAAIPLPAWAADEHAPSPSPAGALV
jgi:hypothetical protein